MCCCACKSLENFYNSGIIIVQNAARNGLHPVWSNLESSILNNPTDCVSRRYISKRRASAHVALQSIV